MLSNDVVTRSAPSQDTAVALSVRNVGKTFSPGRVTLANVSFDVPTGGFTSILGPSGCGKSTLLRMIAGLVTRSAGEIVLDGRRVDAPPPGLIYVFQQYAKSLLPWKTVLGNVAFGADSPRARGTSARRVERSECLNYIELVGLKGYEDSYPTQLSGGMQQRVAIARALVAQPRILLMDEPFSALDALTREGLQDLLLRLWKDLGLTVVFVTHDISEAIYVSDDIVVLAGTPATIAEAIRVKVPRPRHQVSTRESAEFLSLRRDLYRLVLGRDE